MAENVEPLKSQVEKAVRDVREAMPDKAPVPIQRDPAAKPYKNPPPLQANYEPPAGGTTGK